MAKRSAAASGRNTEKSKKTSAAKKGGARRRKSAPQTNRLWSVLIFAVALLLAAVAFIPGQAGWTAVRNACFGVFGWALYLVAPAAVYIAVLVAAGRPYRAKLALCVFILLLVCGAALVFTDYQPDGLKLSQMTKELFALGAQHKGGGVFAVPLGLSLLCWAGRPAANILLVILLMVFGMVLSDVTPADIVDFIRRKADQAHKTAADALAERDQRREVRRTQAEQRQAERQVQR